MHLLKFCKKEKKINCCFYIAYQGIFDPPFRNFSQDNSFAKGIYQHFKGFSSIVLERRILIILENDLTLEC